VTTPSNLSDRDPARPPADREPAPKLRIRQHPAGAGRVDVTQLMIFSADVRLMHGA